MQSWWYHCCFYNFDDPRPRHALTCRQCQHLVATFKWHETSRCDVIIWHLANWYQSISILYPLLVFISCSNLIANLLGAIANPIRPQLYFFWGQTTGSKKSVSHHKVACIKSALPVPSLEFDQVALVLDFNYTPSVNGMSVNLDSFCTMT